MVGHITTKDDGILNVTYGKYYGTSCLIVHYPYNHDVPYEFSTEPKEHYRYVDGLGVYMRNVSML